METRKVDNNVGGDRMKVLPNSTKPRTTLFSYMSCCKVNRESLAVGRDIGFCLLRNRRKVVFTLITFVFSEPRKIRSLPNSKFRYWWGTSFLYTACMLCILKAYILIGCNMV